MRAEFKKIDELMKSQNPEDRKLGWLMVKIWKKNNPLPRLPQDTLVRITCVHKQLGVMCYENGIIGYGDKLHFLPEHKCTPVREEVLEIEAK